MTRTRINPDLAAKIEFEYFSGLKPHRIAQRFPEVGRKTVYTLCNNLKMFGAAYPIVSVNSPGRPRSISPALEDEIADLLIGRLTDYVDEIQY